MTALLSVQGLTVRVASANGPRTILRDVSLDLPAGAALGLVGESGSGKSMTARALMHLLPAGAHAEGAIVFDGADVLRMHGAQLAEYRRRGVSLVPQDPLSGLNPVHTIRDFLTEGLRVNQGVAKRAATAAATIALSEVGIADPDRVLGQHPHQLSGGMLQRVMICSALLAKSRLIVADEPTTALDVTTQAEVVAILRDLRTEHGLSIVFISHDLELAAAVCDRIAVMYAGEIVEEGPVETLHGRGRHPYTRALVEARPSIEAAQHPLPAIEGRPLSAFEAPDGCAFAPRCAWAIDECRSAHPRLDSKDDGEVRCLRADEVAEHTVLERGRHE